MPSAQKITSVYRTSYMANSRSDQSSKHMLDKYDTSKKTDARAKKDAHESTKSFGEILAKLSQSQN